MIKFLLVLISLSLVSASFSGGHNSCQYFSDAPREKTTSDEWQDKLEARFTHTGDCFARWGVIADSNQTTGEFRLRDKSFTENGVTLGSTQTYTPSEEIDRFGVEYVAYFLAEGAESKIVIQYRSLDGAGEIGVKDAYIYLCC